MLAEGQILDGTYKLLRLIGKGGMGEVWEATHARLAGRYAIKVLLQNLSQDPGSMVRFDREARVTSLLQHPNVVQVIDHNTAPDGTDYLVMEYLDGESLAQRMRSGVMSPDTVVNIVEQIAAGLAAAHAHGVVHRDLKPDNVFLVPVQGRSREVVKILDFGISKIRGSVQTLDRQICGTPEYMAPEQIEGRTADVTGLTDQFALAVMAYELLTRRNPFAAPNLQTVFDLILRRDPAPTGLNPAVDAVLFRALSKSHRDRFLSVTTFAEELSGAVALEPGAIPTAMLHNGSVPTIAYASGEIVPERKARHRHGWALPLVLTATAGIGGFFFLDSNFGTRAVHVIFGDSTITSAGMDTPVEAKAVARPTADIQSAAIADARIPNEPEVRVPEEVVVVAPTDASDGGSGSDSVADWALAGRHPVARTRPEPSAHGGGAGHARVSAHLQRERVDIQISPAPTISRTPPRPGAGPDISHDGDETMPPTEPTAN